MVSQFGPHRASYVQIFIRRRRRRGRRRGGDEKMRKTAQKRAHRSGKRHERRVQSGRLDAELGLGLGSRAVGPTSASLVITPTMPPPREVTLEMGFRSLGKLANVNSVEDAAKALSTIVSVYAVQPGPRLDPRYKLTKECLELLKRESELHELLKRAHADKSYDLVRASRTCERLFNNHPDVPSFYS